MHEEHYLADPLSGWWLNGHGRGTLRKRPFIRSVVRVYFYADVSAPLYCGLHCI